MSIPKEGFMAQANTRSSSKQKRPTQGSNSSSASKRASGSNRPAAASSGNGGGSRLPIIAGLATGAAGLIGGAVLGKRLAGSNGLAKQVGKAAKQFKKASKQVGALTDEVRAAREKAEEVGRAFS
jgi:hypothetical protein